MKRFVMVLLGAVVWLAASSAGCVRASTYHTLQKQAADLRETQQATAIRAAKLEKQISDLQSQLDQRQADLDVARKQHAALNASNQQLTEALKSQSGELSKMVSKLTSDKDQLQNQVADLQRTSDALKAKSERDMESMKSTYDRLVDTLKDEVQAGQVAIENMRGMLTISVTQKLFFPSGKADISPRGQNVLKRVAAILHDVPDKHIRVEGHTDNVPIGPNLKNTFATNWDLGAARAVNVVRYLQRQGGIDPNRLSAVSYGAFRPVATNATPKGRARNRRIDIVLISPDLEVHPTQTTPAASRSERGAAPGTASAAPPPPPAAP